jgi:hypothetical protein
MLRLSLLLLCLLFSACTKPLGDWQIVKGSDFREENLDKVYKKSTTAGEAIALLGTPFLTNNESYIFAEQRERPVERSFFFFARPFTEQVTIKSIVYFQNGIVMDVQTKRTEQLLPRD